MVSDGLVRAMGIVPDAADGVIRWWVDGVLNGNHFDVRFPPAGQGFQQFEFAPTVQIPAPAEQYMSSTIRS